MTLDYILFGVLFIILVSINPILTLAYQSPHWSSQSTSLNHIHKIIQPEFGLFILFISLGASLLLSSNDLISVYITLELQSFALYLIASLRTDWISSTGAGLKYFILGAISSALIILGISLIYQVLGTTNFQTLSIFIINLTDLQWSSINSPWITIQLGTLFILSGLIFKISAAPFHNWFADVIENVPTFISILIINIPKISVLSLIFYWLNWIIFYLPLDINGFYLSNSPVNLFIILTTIFSLILGTVSGLVQSKVKRLLAFSTISHVGFILLSFSNDSSSNLWFGCESLIFYLIQYMVTVLLVLIILIAFETGHFKRPIHQISDLINIYQIYPVLTFTFILCLFSIAGIPPLTGFFAKFNVLKCALIHSSYFIAFLAIICSLISAVYYMKLIKLMVFSERQSDITLGSSDINPVITYIITLLTIFIVLFIFDSDLIINSIELMALSFTNLGN